MAKLKDFGDKGPDLTQVPEEFLQAYNVALKFCRERNKGKVVTPDNFHVWLQNHYDSVMKEVEEMFQKAHKVHGDKK